SGTLTFTPGQTSKTVTVFVNGDVIDEIDENYFVDLSDATNATIGDGRGVGTIIDDDDQPSISIGDATVTEGNGSTVNASFSVSLSSASGQTVSVGYATADGTATAGNDYVATGGSLVFSPGQTTKPVNVQVNGDTLDEIDETFTVDLADAVNAAIADGTGVGTIIDNDPLPTVSVNDVTVTEGDSGTVAATFTLGLNVPSGRSLSVDYATADVTATAPADYQASNGTATFAAGQTQQQVTVLVNGDLLDEANETFRLNLSNAVNVTIADGQGTGTITDNDPAPALSVNDVSAVEGDFGTVDATFTISLSAPSGQAVSVDYATADGTATAPADYTAANGTLTFAPGQTTKQVTVQIKSDLLDEANETYFVNLTNASNATISDAQGLGTITDNDPLPALSINDVTVTEGNAGTVAATFTLTLVPVSGRAVSVNYATANGTAQAPADYQAASGTLTFAAGQTTQTVTVLVNGDLLEEADETFLVNLTGPTNATLSDAQGVGTITNDDALPSFSIDDVTVTEGDTGTTNANFTVSLNAPSGRTVSVSYATADGTAHAPNDYQAAGDRLTFAAGQTTKTVTVLVKGDLLNENNETYFVNLSGPTNATITDGQGIGTIVDDDGLPSLSINDVAVTEGNSGTVDATFTVTLSAPSAQSVSIGFATHDGSAHAPDDYFSTGGNLVFNPGQTTKTVTVQVRGDLLDEPDENYFVDLSGPVNATIDDGQGLGTIRDDDAPQPPPAPTPPPPPPPPPPPAVRRAALYSPPAGTRVTIPPMLKWHRVRRARFYNLQLYRKGRKILSLWPSRANLKLHRRWTFAGRALRMTPGAYTWIVWPAYGSRTKPRYGSMLGQSTFRMVAKRRR
ncbi:MAG TPA: Calx-beta domain-containing protein, partial [Gaiellaceae bacterium]|nr:Calx-beta domain-containing protein [Gaiellaceae bacterium]